MLFVLLLSKAASFSMPVPVATSRVTRTQQIRFTNWTMTRAQQVRFSNWTIQSTNATYYALQAHGQALMANGRQVFRRLDVVRRFTWLRLYAVALFAFVRRKKCPQRALVSTLRAQLDSPDLRRCAARCGMPLDDATLSRYLKAASWSLDFPDRSVKAAIEDTVKWRTVTPAAHSPHDGDLGQALAVTSLVSYKRERVLAFQCGVAASDDWADSLVRAVELGSRQNGRVCVVVDCRHSSGGALLSLARAVAPAFPLLSTHYPGRLGRVFVLGAGPASKTCWWFIKNLIDKPTRQKIFFIASLDDLVRYIDADAATTDAALGSFRSFI